VSSRRTIEEGTTSIVEVAERLGLDLASEEDGRLAGVCPFHGGRGFTVVPDDNSWSCSSCELRGSVIELVGRIVGVSGRHAEELLRAGVEALPPKSAAAATTTRHLLGSELDADDDEPTLLGKVAAYYHQMLMSNEEALGFLERRGLRHRSVIDHFKLGFANRTLGYRLPRANRRTGAALRSRLQALGVLRASGHEHLNGSLVVPITSREGEIVQLYGHKLGERLRAGTPPELWLDGREPAIFNAVALDASEVMVTAAIFDALALWQAGLTHVVAVPSNASAEFLSIIAKNRPGALILAFPRTTEGEQAAAALVPELGELGVETRRMVFPAGAGPSEIVMTFDDPRQALQALVRSAEWITGKPAKANVAPAPPRPPVEDGAREPSADALTDGELVMVLGDRRWRIRGLDEARARGSLKLNLFVAREGVGFHADKLDLYSARHRTAFVRVSAVELGLDEATIKKDLGAVLLAAEEAQEELLRKRQRPEPVAIELTAEEREEATDLLQDPNLLDRVLDDFEVLGVVGEKDNLLVAFLVTISRKLAQPLAALVQSSSAAGKSSLLSAVLDFVPDEDRVIYSAMTGQSLYYVGANDLRHKVLSIAEEQGAERAAYSLKLLQSDGALTIASTGKETGTGRLVSHEYRVHGPLALMMTTTKISLDGELLNRCLVIAVDESPEQTRRIQARQRWRQTLKGIVASERKRRLVRLHHNAQRLLRPLRIVNPFAGSMEYPDYRVRARRDHQKLLSLIEAVALLHQHQRKLRTVELDGAEVEYVEVEVTDIEIAERLMKQVGTVGTDDLPPHTKRVLGLLDEMVGELATETSVSRTEIRFTRRQARERLGLGDTQLWVHLRRLVAAEYLLMHPARLGRTVVYELAYCSSTTTAVRDASAQIRPTFGPDSAVVRPPFSGEDGEHSDNRGDRPDIDPQKRKQAHAPKRRNGRSSKRGRG
jgi:DNA primase